MPGGDDWGMPLVLRTRHTAWMGPRMARHVPGGADAGGDACRQMDGSRQMVAIQSPIPRRIAVTPRVLLVEDDRDIRELMQAGLEDAGFRVAAMADGECALTWAATHRPAAVVLDMRLPGMDGVEVARRLRAALGATLPILVVTAVADPLERTERAGGMLYLRKPFAMVELVTAVHAVLSAASPPRR
jgi:CheY-like chemotaxis protein